MVKSKLKDNLFDRNLLKPLESDTVTNCICDILLKVADKNPIATNGIIKI